MDLSLAGVVLALCLCLSSANHRYHHYFKGHHAENNDQYDERENDNKNTNKPKVENENVKPKLIPIKVNQGYEVTENIIDIPNNEVVRPILTNYTLNKPLNLAVIPNNTNKEKQDNTNNFYGNTGDYLEEDFYDIKETSPEVNEHFNGIKNAFVKGLKDLRKEVVSTAAVPISFLNSLHKEAVGVVKQFHSLFKHNSEEDGDEFENY